MQHTRLKFITCHLTGAVISENANVKICVSDSASADKFWNEVAWSNYEQSAFFTAPGSGQNALFA